MEVSRRSKLDSIAKSFFISNTTSHINSFAPLNRSDNTDSNSLQDEEMSSWRQGNLPEVQIDLSQRFLNLQRPRFSILVHTSCYSTGRTLFYEMDKTVSN